MKESASYKWCMATEDLGVHGRDEDVIMLKCYNVIMHNEGGREGWRDSESWRLGEVDVMIGGGGWGWNESPYADVADAITVY